MTTAFLIGAIVFGIFILIIVSRFGRRLIQPLNRKYFDPKWAELLSRVKTPEGMALAVIDADKLLDEALKRKGYKGKTMGERLVAAQRALSNNDGVWYAHKLRTAWCTSQMPDYAAAKPRTLWPESSKGFRIWGHYEKRLQVTGGR